MRSVRLTPSGSSGPAFHAPMASACVTPAATISRRNSEATVFGASLSSGASGPVPGRFGGTAWM